MSFANTVMQILITKMARQSALSVNLVIVIRDMRRGYHVPTTDIFQTLNGHNYRGI